MKFKCPTQVGKLPTDKPYSPETESVSKAFKCFNPMNFLRIFTTIICGFKLSPLRYVVDDHLNMMKNEYIRMGSVVAKEKMTKEVAWSKSEKALLEAAKNLQALRDGEPLDVAAGLALH